MFSLTAVLIMHDIPHVSDTGSLLNTAAADPRRPETPVREFTAVPLKVRFQKPGDFKA